MPRAITSCMSMVISGRSQTWVCEEPTRLNPGSEGSRHSADRRLALARVLVGVEPQRAADVGPAYGPVLKCQEADQPLRVWREVDELAVMAHLEVSDQRTRRSGAGLG